MTEPLVTLARLRGTLNRLIGASEELATQAGYMLSIRQMGEPFYPVDWDKLREATDDVRAAPAELTDGPAAGGSAAPGPEISPGSDI